MTAQDGTPKKIRVLLVDDHPFFREGLRLHLSQEVDIDIVGEVSAGDEALRSIAELKPEVVLLDVNIPKINGIQVSQQLRSEQTKPAIVLITGYDDRDQAIHAIRAGASSYCSKEVEPSVLVEVIRQVAQGYFYVENKSFDKAGIEEWLDRGIKDLTNPYVDSDEHFVPLSPREMEILRYVTLGNSNQEIAYMLKISHQTVKNHMTSILRKLDVQDRTQAAVYAIAHGWVRVNDALGEEK